MMAAASAAINWTIGYFFAVLLGEEFDLCRTTPGDGLGTTKSLAGVGGSGTRGVAP